MRTGPAYAGPSAPEGPVFSAGRRRLCRRRFQPLRGSRRCGVADGVDDEVGAALEEQVEQPTAADEADRAAQHGHEARFVEAGGARRLDGVADARGNRAARAELPGRVEPFLLAAYGEELAVLPQLLDLARVDAETTREPGAGERSGGRVVHGRVSSLVSGSGCRAHARHPQHEAEGGEREQGGDQAGEEEAAAHQIDEATAMAAGSAGT